MSKATNRIVDLTYLKNRAEGLERSGYDKPKWVGFCEYFLSEGYKISLYEARKTVSKYVTVIGNDGRQFKVRFSNHKPIAAREARGDCDFFVGYTNFGVTTTAQAVAAVENYFSANVKPPVVGKDPAKWFEVIE